MQRYLATARMCMREERYFGAAEIIGTYILRALSLLAMLAIWAALFTQGADISGMTLGQMLTYTLLSTVLYPLINVQTPASSWLHDGTMLGLYQRPASVFSQLMAHTMGRWVLQLLFFSLPVLGIAGLLGIRVTPATAWFFPSLLLAVAQGFAVDFLFACLLMRARNLEWVVHSIRVALNALLTGAVIPFAILPWGLGEWLALSPLGTLAGAPLSLFAGLESPGRLLLAQLFWTVTLWPLAIYWFKKSRERMVSYGG